MSKLTKILVIALAAVMLGGCVVSVGGSRNSSEESGRKQVERENRETIAQLRDGVHIEEVRRRMGTPDFIEGFSREGHTWEVLFYRTHRVAADGMTTRDETTPLVFQEGLLVSRGESAWRNLTGRPLAARR